MDEAHGGMHAADDGAPGPVPQQEDVNYRQQEELLRQVEVRRAAARQRIIDQQDEAARRDRLQRAELLEQFRRRAALDQPRVDAHARAVAQERRRAEQLEAERRRGAAQWQQQQPRQDSGWGCWIM